MSYVSDLNTVGYKILLKVALTVKKSLKEKKFNLVHSFTRYFKPRHYIIYPVILSQ